MEMIHMPSRGAATTNRQLASQEPGGRRELGLGPASQEVRGVLEAGVVSRRWLFPEDGPPRSVEEWRPPAITDKAVGRAVWSRLDTLDACLSPAPRAELMSRVLVLLAHFRSAAQADAVEQGIADDWAEDLEVYPMWAIEDAARAWRRTKKFRPQISEMIELCEAATGGLSLERHRLQSIVEAAERGANPLAAQVQALARGIFADSDDFSHRFRPKPATFSDRSLPPSCRMLQPNSEGGEDRQVRRTDAQGGLRNGNS